MLGEKSMSQFERAMNDHGVLVIRAFSPRTRGRAERLFGTFQDILIKEMGLRKIQSKESAKPGHVWNIKFKLTGIESIIQDIIKMGHFYFVLTNIFSPLTEGLNYHIINLWWLLQSWQI